MKVAPTMVKMTYSWKKLTSITPSQDVSNPSMIFQTYDITGRDYSIPFLLYKISTPFMINSMQSHSMTGCTRWSFNECWFVFSRW
jgi:hypothetical protein